MQCLLMPMLLRTEERDCKKKKTVTKQVISDVAKGNLGKVNPLVPELSITAHADPRPFFHLC